MRDQSGPEVARDDRSRDRSPITLAVYARIEAARAHEFHGHHHRDDVRQRERDRELSSLD